MANSHKPAITLHTQGINGTSTLNTRGLKMTKSTDTLTSHPLLNEDDDLEVNAAWFNQRSRRSPSSGSTSSQALLQPKINGTPVPNGSVGASMLNMLKEMTIGFSDVVQLLISKKATVLLATAAVTTPFLTMEREFLEDNIIITQQSDDKILAITLSGIRVVLLGDSLISIGLLPTEQELGNILDDTTKKQKTLFDAFSSSTDPSSFPAIKIISHNADIMLHGMNIRALLIETPLIKREVSERVNFILEKTEKIKEISDLPGSLPEDIQRFVKEYQQTPMKSEETSTEKIQDLFDSVRSKLEAGGELTEEQDAIVESKLNSLEKFVCSALYENLFIPPWSDDDLSDEALCSKIAALNLLELGLVHLGVVVQSHQQSLFDDAIQTAGAKLQCLQSMKSPIEKLNVIVDCHRIIVDTLSQSLKTQSKSDTKQPKDNPEQPKDNPEQPKNNSEQPKNNSEQPIDNSEQSSDNSEQPNDSPEHSNDSPERSNDIPEHSNDIPEHSNDIPEHPKTPISPVTPTSPIDERRVSNADAILPMLIFIVVKANPRELISNLRFIQRYRVRSLLHGELSYCLTNALAVVSFLENVELQVLGLSPEKVVSDVTDIHRTSPIPPLPTPPSQQPSLPFPLADPRRVGYEIVGAATDSGLKVITGITGVVDTSYKMFGRILGYNDAGRRETKNDDGSINEKQAVEVEVSSPIEENGKRKRFSLLERELPDGKELAEIGKVKEDDRTKKNQDESNEVENGKSERINEDTDAKKQAEGGLSLTNRLRQISVLPRFSSERSQSVTETKHAAPIQAKKIAPPITKFLECKSEDFRVGDVAELLAEYKRLASAVQELGLFSTSS
ncbi:8078_t:CDS:10 [Paraglomus brasilianum]|uniref:8078_t:CDS:1 n=1 Tax=Paraglomus brasilianum TaxID=144538 RepID=A0A9N8ZJA2_9GLOM|nr:8078_t:CDS:10 [Paraglomus brasilianum]